MEFPDFILKDRIRGPLRLKTWQNTLGYIYIYIYFNFSWKFIERIVKTRTEKRRSLLLFVLLIQVRITVKNIFMFRQAVVELVV